MTDRRSPPVGKVSRATVAGMTAAKIGAKKVGLLSKRPFLSRPSFEEHRRANDDDVARILFDGLSTLRGTALKLAQLLSLEFGILPEAYLRELSKAHYRVPPLNRAVVRQLVISEFGAAPDEIFHAFDSAAFAAASLGQVHRATLPSGERAAVKVQYPGIDAALKNDLQLVRRFVLPFMRSEYVSRWFQEVEQHLVEELDYHTELEHTRWFFEHVQTGGILVPEPFAKYSSKRVLATAYVEGDHLEQWLETNPSQSQRDAVAQRMYDFFAHSVFEGHRIHSDPNPGNYLFRADGAVAVIDFGSVKVFDPAFAAQLAAVCRAYIGNDTRTIVDIYCTWGLAGGDVERVEQHYRDVFLPFAKWFTRPFRQAVFDFGRHPEYCEEGLRVFRELAPLRVMNGFTSETAMFDRNMYGLFRVFTKMGARVRMQNQWLY